jgi:hypothetical protein
VEHEARRPTCFTSATARPRPEQPTCFIQVFIRQAVGAAHLGVVMRLEEVRPPVIVIGWVPGGIGPLLGAEASTLGPDRVPPAFGSCRRWQRDADPVDSHPPPAAVWQTRVRRNRVSRALQRPRLRHGEADAAEAVRREDVLAG